MTLVMVIPKMALAIPGLYLPSNNNYIYLSVLIEHKGKQLIFITHVSKKLIDPKANFLFLHLTRISDYIMVYSKKLKSRIS